MNKNLTKKALVPALVMALASVIALSGVTYAWFTTGNTATVGSLDVNVQTANGIQVSLDAQSWKSAITANDILNAITNGSNVSIQYPYGTANDPVEIAPVSSAGNYVNGKMEMFYGEYNKDGTLRSEAEVEQTRKGDGNFIALDLYFKTSSAEQQPLKLELGEEKSYVKCIDFATGVDSTVGTDTAVRVAFLPLGTAASPEAARALAGSGTALIWEPNSTKHAAGVDKSGKQAYSGFKAAFDAIAEESLGDNEVKAVNTFDTDQVIVNLTNGITKVRVYIWLEGQDVDCINNISNGDFRTNLYFSVPETQA